MATVEFDRATVGVGGSVILRDIDLTVDQGEFVGLIGPSGCGKTTLLRAVAGFSDIVAGTLRLDGVDVSRVKTADRDVGMVFQDPALFSNRSVRGNVAFPLEIRRQHIEEIRERVGAEARAMHLEHLLQRRPDQLSRGESQLVQIARAMVRTPGVLLLDEPLASLDEVLKARLRTELAMLQAGYGVTTMMSTNDPQDAMLMPTRLAVIHDGAIVQVGTPDEIRRRPPTLDAAMATGDFFTIPVRVERDADGFWLMRPGTGRSPAFRHRAWSPALADHVGRQLVAGIRPHDVHVVAGGSVTALVDRIVPGQAVAVMCEIAGRRVGVSGAAHVTAGEVVTLRIDDLVLFDPATGAAVS